MRYFIDIIDKDFLASNSTNAASKPRTDTMRTAIRCGYKPIILNCYWRFDSMPHSIKEKIQKKAYWTTLRWQMRKLRTIYDSDVFVQYPFLSPLMMEALQMLKSNGNRIIVLFHDFYMLRERRVDDKMEKWLLQNIDIAIVHTTPMADAFRNFGFKGEIKLLHYFDYLCHIPVSTHNISDIKVLYAGNLEKSAFVKELHNMQHHTDMQFLLYGKPEMASSQNVVYKGSFDSEHIEGVEGNWGLVWDGDSIDTCNGTFGEYLKYNAPFKFSLYLALGIPVIVWKESAMAKYVKEYNLGVCVSNINEIHSAIRSLTNTDISKITAHVRTAQKDVAGGKMLERALLA